MRIENFKLKRRNGQYHKRKPYGPFRLLLRYVYKFEQYLAALAKAGRRGRPARKRQSEAYKAVDYATARA